MNLFQSGSESGFWCYTKKSRTVFTMRQFKIRKRLQFNQVGEACAPTSESSVQSPICMNCLALRLSYLCFVGLFGLLATWWNGCLESRTTSSMASWVLVIIYSFYRLPPNKPDRCQRAEFDYLASELSMYSICCAYFWEGLTMDLARHVSFVKVSVPKTAFHTTHI